MLSHALTLLVGYLAVACSRETIRPMPTITNSLVNLGKMEISFYFNGNGRDPPAHRIPDHGQNLPSTFQRSFSNKNEPFIEEPCLCSSLRNAKDSFLSNPSGLFNKILMHNDLFSFNKDPLSSTLCCDSHELVQEGTVVFEFAPNQKTVKPNPRRLNPLPMMPFLFDSVIPKKSVIPPLNTKAIEIFLFPKKKEMGSNEIPRFQPKKKDPISKKGITIVGDKKLENNVKLFKPVPVMEKDVSIQEKNEKENEKPTEEPDKLLELSSKPNTV